MLVSKAKLHVSIAALASVLTGCQVIGGISSELVVTQAEGLPPRDPLSWEAIDPAPSFVYTLPEWLLYGSPNDTRSSQLGPSTLRLGYMAHEARPRNVGSGWGLSMERSRTNVLPVSLWGGTGWSMGDMMPGAGLEDPTGEKSATGYLSMGKQQSDAYVVIEPQATVASSFVMGTGFEAGSAPPYAYFVLGGAYAPVTEPSYKRYDVKRVMGEPAPTFALTTHAVGDAPAILGVTGFAAYAPQVEEGKYPSSYIPTEGAPKMRHSDNLSMETLDFAPSGYFSVKIRYAPHYATDEQSFDHDLVAIEDDFVFLRMRPGGKLILFAAALPVGQQELQIEGLTWSRDQSLEVEASYLPEKRFLSIKGATTGDNTKTQLGRQPALGKDPTTWLMGDNDGAQESADLQFLEVR